MAVHLLAVRAEARRLHDGHDQGAGEARGGEGKGEGEDERGTELGMKASKGSGSGGRLQSINQAKAADSAHTIGQRATNPVQSSSQTPVQTDSARLGIPERATAQ